MPALKLITSRYRQTISFLLIIFVFTIGFFTATKPIAAQTKKEPNTNCATQPFYQGGSFSSRFEDPYDDCSIGYYPVNYEHRRFKNFIDHAVLQCIDSPRIVLETIGDLDKNFTRLFGSQPIKTNEIINLNQIANFALGAEIEAENSGELPRNIRALLSYFDRYNMGLTASLCHQQGSTDYKSCVKEMGACLSGSGPCRENYLLTGSTMSRLTTTKQQYQYYFDRCQLIVGSTSRSLDPNAMEEDNPTEHNTWLDKYGTNVDAICKEVLPKTYEEFTKLPSKDLELLAQIPHPLVWNVVFWWLTVIRLNKPFGIKLSGLHNCT
jgi:hypothetical protein